MTEKNKSGFSSLEICAGAGGQAVGLERAGFQHAALAEIDKDACATLRLNRPDWDVREVDIHALDGKEFLGVDLVAGGVPCPPFSMAGKQLGPNDERDLFPQALRLVEEAQPRAVMLENVAGLAQSKFSDYRSSIISSLQKLGYRTSWQLVHAHNFGVPQLRPRFILVALKPPDFERFHWPVPWLGERHVGIALHDLMAANGWRGADAWSERASAIAPTLVGGSKKHGGPDLGPTRAKKQWATLSVDGMGIADSAPSSKTAVRHIPRLTVRMAARIQGFPDTWEFSGRKTAAYRQIGNAFPPPVAYAVGSAIRLALGGGVK
jgi:DNA (cytosine-5)-methyltransferase 1